MIERILQIWTAGGWVMIPLGALALLLFGAALKALLHLGRMQFRRLRDAQWMAWVRDPAKADGEVGEMIRYTQDEARSSEEISMRFAEIAAAHLPPIDRQVGTIGTFVAAAPLVGLLGTVLGMLVTFQALAAGGGGGKVTEAMAAGISQALFPPEVGLCIALPGLILLQWIKRQRQEFEAFLARLESYTLQHFRRQRGTPFVPPLEIPADSTPASTGRGEFLPQPA
ncbi:MAG: MotA/TolQ/ExbB proton channel family protein [Limisphaerales bacterium]